MPVIRWESPGPRPTSQEAPDEPPPDPAGQAWVQDLALQLEARPEQWAVVVESTDGAECRYRFRLLMNYDRIWVEVRGQRGGLITLYACWSHHDEPPEGHTATVYDFRSGAVLAPRAPRWWQRRGGP